jgi:nitronate monooxygenase
VHSVPSPSLCERLGLDFPLMLAGMGGVAGPRLVAAVADAGCAGTLGLYKAPPPRIAELIAETEHLTARSYGINFVPEVIGEPELQANLGAALRAATRLSFVSFFGLPSPAVAELVRAAGVPMIVQIGTLLDALQAVELGAAALVVQGTEAGGHLLGTQGVAEIGALVRARVGVPLFAAGGIGSGADLARLEPLGFEGCCLGTRFVAAADSNAHQLYKAAVVRSQARDTEIAEVFEIGWPRRRHRVTGLPAELRERRLPSSPIATTSIYGGRQPIFRYSAAVPTSETSGAIEQMALYCGTSCEAVSGVQPAAEIVREFVAEYRAAGAPAVAR